MGCGRSKAVHVVAQSVHQVSGDDRPLLSQPCSNEEVTEPTPDVAGDDRPLLSQPCSNEEVTEPTSDVAEDDRPLLAGRGYTQTHDSGSVAVRGTDAAPAGHEHAGLLENSGSEVVSPGARGDTYRAQTEPPNESETQRAQTLKEAMDACKKSEEEGAALKTGLAEREAEMAKLQALIAELSEQLKKAEGQAAELQAAKEERERKNAELEKELKGKGSELEEAKKNGLALRAGNEGLEKSIGDLKGQLEKMRGEYEKAKAEAEKQGNEVAARCKEVDELKGRETKLGKDGAEKEKALRGCGLLSPSNGSAEAPEIRIQEPATKQERNAEMVQAIVHGHWETGLEEMLLACEVPKIIRVFLSSTFTDTAEERNCILREVVPKLQAQFAKYGYEFQASEMRWSIRAGESDDMQTSGICMAELTNCQASAGLNYLYIACDKYGFRPPPKTIPLTVFGKLVTALNEADRQIVEECYKLDTNSVPTPAEFKPPVPACGPSRQVRDEWDGVDEATYVLQINTNEWARFEKLVSILRTAALKVWDSEREAARSPKSNHWLKKFIISVTEEEFCHGLLWANPEPGCTRVKVFKRSFTNAEGPGSLRGIPLLDPKAKNFVDMKEKGEVDREAQELLEQQKAMHKADHAWTIPWVPGKGVDPENEDHKKYLTEFCACFEEYCVKSLNEALAKEIKPDPVVDEAESHLRFAAQRARKFHPTPTAMTVLGFAKTFLDTGREGKAFVVHGKSGAGKTYIMSELTRQAAVQARASGGVCVIRFLGTTAASSKTALLLESLVLQLAQAYGQDTSSVSIPSDFRELQALFIKAVKTWPSEAKPLTLILDSVDQLDDTNGGRRLEWLPATGLPTFVRIIVSSLPDYAESNGKTGFKCLSRLRSTIKDEACFSMVEDITDPKEVVEHLLRLQGRTITEEQMQAVLDAFDSRGADDMAGTPLWLTLVAQQCAGWRSYDPPPVIASSVRDLILRLFEDLAKKHGTVLVWYVLAYITRCKEGITEVELALLLSLVDDVLAESYEWWAPPVRVVPCICVTRTHADLRPYLATRGSGNALGWYHRQFWEAAEAWLFGSEGCACTQKHVHAQLADFFAGTYHKVAKSYTPKLQKVVQKHFAGETAGDRLVPAQPTELSGDVLDPESTAHVRLNERRLTEYVHHCIRAGMEEEATAELTSIMHILCMFRARMGTELQIQLLEAMDAFPARAQKLKKVKAFVGKRINACREPDVPGQVVLEALNEPDASPVFKSAASVCRERGLGWATAMTWKNKPQAFDPCQLSIQAGDVVQSMAYSPDGTSVAFGYGSRIDIVNVSTGDTLCTLEGHTERVTSVSFAPDGKTLASGSGDKTVKLWDAASGAQMSSLEGHTSYVNSVTFAPDGKTVASGSVDRTVKLWDAASGSQKSSLGGHIPGNPSCKCTHTQGVLGWECKHNPMCPLEGHTDYVTSVSFAPDGKTLASGSWDNTVKLWDAASGAQMSSLEGHTNWVTSVSFAPDGKTLASGSWDKTVKLWDTEAGSQKCTLEGDSFCFCDGGYVATALDRVVRVYTLDGKPIAFFTAPTSVTALAFKHQHLVLGCASGQVVHLDTAFQVVVQ